MERKLETLREVLWTKFEEAVGRHPDYEDSRSSGSSTPFNPKIENRNAIANLAQAIVSLEHEITVQAAYEELKASGRQIESEVMNGIVRDISTLDKVKLRKPGNTP